MSLKISWLSCQRNLPNSTPFSFIVEKTLEYTQEEKRQQQWLLSVCTTQMQPPNPDLKDTSAPVVASLLVRTDVNFGVDMLTGTWVESTELCPYWARKLFFDPIIIRNCHLSPKLYFVTRRTNLGCHLRKVFVKQIIFCWKQLISILFRHIASRPI